MCDWWKTKRDWSRLGWSVVFVALGLMQLFYYFQARKNLQEFGKLAIAAEGVVTFARQGWRSRDDGEPPYIRYRFQARDGREYSGESEVYVPEGEKVIVNYLPRDPATNHAVGGEDRGEYKLLMFVILVFFGLIEFMYGFSDATLRMMSSESRNKFLCTPFERFPIIILCSASAYMLYKAPQETYPYVYYQILRVVVWATAIMLAVLAYRWGNAWAPWLFGLLALLFNPLVPFHLSRDTWARIDLVSAIVFLIAAFKMKPPEIEEFEIDKILYD